MSKGENELKRILSIVMMSLLFCSVVTASSINGDYKGKPIVKVKVNGKELTIEDVPAMIDDGRTMVPLYLLKQLGYDLTWDAQAYTVDMKPSPTMSKDNRKKVTKKDLQGWTDRIGYMLAYKSNNVPFSQGTGFIISPDGLMITNHHVIDGGTRFEFDMAGSAYKFSGNAFDNPTTDLFGFNLNSIPEFKDKKLPYLSYTTQLPEVGDRVFAVGYPQGSFTVTDGIVAAINEFNEMKMISHTAYINRGSSGGVLLNEYGDVIGVTNAINESVKQDFALPFQYVIQEIDKLKK
jgi:S1-C subfamily serine protease